MTSIIKRAFNTPYINIWNPICKKYMWVRIIYCLQDNDKAIKNNNNKMVQNLYMVNLEENNFCKCNKYLICNDELIFRTSPHYKSDRRIDKIKVFPEPELGKKNVYTNKYEGINLLDLYKTTKLKYPRQIKMHEPNLKCTCNELK